MSQRNLPGVVAAAGLLAAAFAAPAAAQGGDGYLFREPRVSASFRVGYEGAMGPRTLGGEGDVFRFTQDLLAIDRSDHDALLVGGEIAVRLAPRLDLALDFTHVRSEVFSKFRDWVDNNDLPIQQTTAFTRQPLNLSLRYFLMDRGTQVSRFAWVPRDVAPYVGGGVGVTWYEFEQEGDFIDFDTFEVFSDRLVSDGSTATAHLLAGLQYSLAAQVVLTGEGRYRFGSGELDRDFVGFDDLDLSGFDFVIGIGVRF
ncbi:MAG: hypothetical protein RQ751_05310 [Longimicrobiales bacterium]|nr:hypothetical protein [Longimicrobiales bacterium]